MGGLRGFGGVLLGDGEAEVVGCGDVLRRQGEGAVARDGVEAGPGVEVVDLDGVEAVVGTSFDDRADDLEDRLRADAVDGSRTISSGQSGSRTGSPEASCSSADDREDQSEPGWVWKPLT